MSRKVFVFLLILSICLPGKSSAQESEMRDEANELRRRELYAEALEKYLILERSEEEISSEQRWKDFTGMQACMQRLLRCFEIESKLDALLARHPQDAYLHWQAASYILDLPSWGIMQGDKFLRNYQRGTGRHITVSERDRRKSLFLFEKARLLVEQGQLNDRQKTDFYLSYAGALLSDRYKDLYIFNLQQSGEVMHMLRALPGLAWRLLLLTDLQEIPAWDEAEAYAAISQGAPVNANGEPIYFAMPDSFTAAANDGERLRWLLQQAGKIDAESKEQVDFIWANFAYALYGEYSLEQYRHIFFDPEDPERSAAILNLAQLSDCETIARLADAPRRFELPADYCFINLFKALQNAENKNVRLNVWRCLARIYENRRQFEPALHYLRLLEKESPYDAQPKIFQIIGDLGSFMPTPVQTNTEKLSVDFKFRNAKSVTLRLYRLDLAGIFNELRTCIKEGDAERPCHDLACLGRWISHYKGKKFIQEELRSWQEQLEPLPQHADTLRNLEISIPGPGAYWLVAELPGGHLSHIPLLSRPYMLLLKPLQGEQLWQLLRADDGEPVPNTELELFIWQRQWDRRLRRSKLVSAELRLHSDAKGCAYVKKSDLPEGFPADMQWLVQARPIHGKDSVFICVSSNSRFHAVDDSGLAPAPCGLLLSDRPIYKPGQALHYKGWLKKPVYIGDSNVFVGKRAALWLCNPKGEQIALSRAAQKNDNETDQQAESLPDLFFDANGAISGEYQIPEQADLGMYNLWIAAEKVWGEGACQLSFRVEEYRKPDFELIWQLPEKPPKLGESFTVGLQACYYFGAPVSFGKAKIKVFRQPRHIRPLPWRAWDWLYGAGYWLPDQQSDSFDMIMPSWPGTYVQHMPDSELFQSLELELNEQGRCNIKIDTSIVLQLYGEQNQCFNIMTEVEDASKRSIRASSNIMVGKKAFTAYSWANRGYYHSGSSVEAQVQLRSLDNKPVSGKGVLQLYRLTYEQAGQIREELLHEWECLLDAQGNGSQKLVAAKEGQYKLLWRLRPEPEPGESIEASNIINVYGSKAKSDDFQFKALELLCEKSEYAVGEQVHLRINSQYANSLVYIYLRPENGVCRRPQAMRLNGHSAELAIPVLPQDMPNFFVEAQLVAGGELHQCLRSIAVPPIKKTLHLEVAPVATQLQPGEQAELVLNLKDSEGRPFVGELVVAVYDKSLESVGGALPGDLLKQRFWSWTRQHHFSSRRMSWELRNFLFKNETAMKPLGLFVEPALVLQDSSKMVRAGAAFGSVNAPESLMKAAVPAGAAAGQVDLSEADGEFADTELRQDFADTAFWTASLWSRDDGGAKVSFTLPDDLSTWKVRVWAMGAQCEVGEAQSELLSSKKMTVRLIAPRFFQERDRILLGAVVRHELPESQRVRGLLELEGDCLDFMPGAEAMQDFELAPGRDFLLQWPLTVKKSGEAIIRVKALSALASDATQQSFPVKVYGMQQQMPFCGRMAVEQEGARFSFTVPEEISPGSAHFELAWAPSLALSMLEALPGLEKAELGTSEQRLNSFLPALLLRRNLLAAGFNLAELSERKASLNPQKLSDDPRPTAAVSVLLYDGQQLDALLQKGLRDLQSMRCADGGWGWFSGWRERSSAHITAQIVHGLLLARQNGVAVEDELLEPGLEWLQNYQKTELSRLQAPKNSVEYKPHADNLDALVLKVLCEVPEPIYEAKMAELLFRDRKGLSLYGKALFAMAECRLQLAAGADLSKAEKMQELMRNLRQYLEEDAENQTAHLISPISVPFWYWYGDIIETQAIYLQLLCMTGQGRSQQAAGLVKYLLNNRYHGGYWKSSRDTAAVVEAFCTYLDGSGELNSELQVQIGLDGKVIAQSQLRKDKLLSADNRLLLSADVLHSGKHEVSIDKQGGGPLYFNAYLSYFNLADDFDEAGMELRVQRKVYRLEERDGEQTVPDKYGLPHVEKRDKYKKHLLLSEAEIKQGDLLEVELLVDGKNDYEYIMIEDYKAAGCESLEQLSGYQHAGSLWPYVEYRQDRVCFLLSWLPHGKHSLTYRLKAENAGRFSALPAVIKGVYAPELRGNSRRQAFVIEVDKGSKNQ